MKKALLLKLIICFSAFSFYLYSIVQRQNYLNSLSYKLPKLEKELKTLEEDNLKLSYQLETFSDPNNLLQLVKTNTYSHLRYPILEDILNLNEGLALKPQSPYKLKKLPVEDHSDTAIAHR